MRPFQRSGRRPALRALAAALGAFVLGAPALAQGVPERGVLSGPADASARAARPGPKRGGDEPLGFRAGDVLIYPSLFTGFTYDDNVYATRRNRTDDVAFRVAPTLVAKSALGGRHEVLAYVTGDARTYLRAPRADAFDAAVGGLATVEVQRDLVLRGQLEYAHRTEDPGTGDAFFGALPLRGVLREAIPFDQGYGALSLTKTFNRLYVSVGGSVLGQDYAEVRDLLRGRVDEGYRDGIVGTLNGRVGYRVTPLVSTFVELSGNLRDFRAAGFDGTGVRIVAGLASERIGLFHGEVYGGYQRQDYGAASFGTVDGGVFGGRVVYEPTRLLSFALSVDQTIDESGFIAAPGAIGAVRRTTLLALRGDYQLLRDLTLTARGGYEHGSFVRGGGEADIARLGLGATYRLTRHFAAVLDLTQDRASSRVAGVGYVRNRVTAGVRTRF